MGRRGDPSGHCREALHSPISLPPSSPLGISPLHLLSLLSPGFSGSFLPLLLFLSLFSPSPFLRTPQAFHKKQRMEGHPPLHSCCSVSHPKGLRRGSRASGHIWRDPAGITASPNLPLASAFSPSCLLPGGLRASFWRCRSGLLFLGHLSIAWVGGNPSIPHPKVPLLCFYTLNWRFIF